MNDKEKWPSGLIVFTYSSTFGATGSYESEIAPSALALPIK